MSGLMMQLLCSIASHFASCKSISHSTVLRGSNDSILAWQSCQL
jgi:hypothetical protein